MKPIVGKMPGLPGTRNFCGNGPPAQRISPLSLEAAQREVPISKDDLVQKYGVTEGSGPLCRCGATMEQPDDTHRNCSKCGRKYEKRESGIWVETANPEKVR